MWLGALFKHSLHCQAWDWGLDSVQCPSTLCGKNFLLISNLNISCLSFIPLPWVLSLAMRVKRSVPALSCSSGGFSGYSKGGCKDKRIFAASFGRSLTALYLCVQSQVLSCPSQAQPQSPCSRAEEPSGASSTPSLVPSAPLPVVHSDCWEMCESKVGVSLIWLGNTVVFCEHTGYCWELCF